MNKETDHTLKAILFCVVGYTFFSGTDALVKVLSGYNYSPYQISFLYSFLSIFVLLAFAKPLGGLKKTLQTKERKKHLIRALLFAPTGAINYYAFSVLPLANAYAVIFFAPFLTALLAIPLLGERATKVNWIFIFVGFAGVLVAMRPDIYGFSAPILLLFVTALFIAFRNVMVRQMGPDETPLSFALYPGIAISLSMIIPAYFTWEGLTIYTTTLFALGGLGTAIGALLTSIAFRYAPTSIVAPFHYTQLVWAAILGALFFEGFPDFWTIIGCVVITLSGIGLIRMKKKS